MQINAVTIIMAGILAAGLLFYIIPSSGLGRLYRQSREPGQMKSRYLKNMTKRFETAYALRQGVPNVEVFVRKYLLGYKVAGISVSGWQNLGSISILSAMFGSLGVGIWQLFHGQPRQALYYVGLGVVVSGFLVIVDCLSSVEKRLNRIRIFLVDYMENTMKPKPKRRQSEERKRQKEAKKQCRNRQGTNPSAYAGH
ncbi:MAG: hypothetical protein ACLSCU_03290 [Eubacterium sp.]